MTWRRVIVAAVVVVLAAACWAGLRYVDDSVRDLCKAGYEFEPGVCAVYRPRK